jgi:hypothetical protein
VGEGSGIGDASGIGEASGMTTGGGIAGGGGITVRAAGTNDRGMLVGAAMEASLHPGNESVSLIHEINFG